MAASDDLLDQAAAIRENKNPNLVEQTAASDTLLDDLATERKRRTDAVLDVVTKMNPDKAAEANKLARQFNLDPATVEKSQDELARLARIKETQQLLQASPFLARQIEDPAFAAIAQDDLENTNELVRKLRQFEGGAVEAVGMAASGTGRLLDIAQRNLLGGFASVFLPKPMAAGAPTRESLVGPLIGEDWQRVGGTVKDFARDGLMVPQAQQTFADQVAGGLGQVAGQIAMLPLARGAGLYAQGADVMGEKIAPDIAAGQGMQDLATLIGAGITGVTEKWALDKLLGPLAVPVKNQIGASLARIGIAAASEGAQEFTENTLQDITRKALTNRDAEINLGQSVEEGGVGAAVGGIVRTVVEAGLHVRTRGVRAEQAEQRTQIVEQLNQLAGASLVASRDVQVFEDMVAKATEDGPVQNLYIDANTLMQSGVAEQLAQVSPAVAKQLPTALATGGEVRIPIAEYTARIAPTELAQSLVDDLRIEGEDFTRRQAQEYMQSGQVQELQQMVERTITAQGGDAEFKASQERVKTAVLEQLNTLNRFTPQKNEIDAVLIAARSAVRAAQLGMTPEQFFEKQRLRMQAEGVAVEAYGRRDKLDSSFMPAGGDSRLPNNADGAKADPLESSASIGGETLIGISEAASTVAGKLGDQPAMGADGIVDQGETPRSVSESAPGVYNQARKATRDDYTQDLFGLPADSGADRSAGRPAAGRPEGRLSRDDAPGTFATRTELVTESTRTLGTDRVTTPAEAAQALAYLGKGAVERFDALITDADGKPLAVVGAFKGALSQAAVYPSTLAAEAFRIDGAANIWFAHNHPSGNPELSAADRNLHRTLSEVFRGSEIRPQGLFAIAGRDGDGRRWVFEPDDRSYGDTRGTTTAGAREATVPVVERVFAEDAKLGPAITSPDVAKDAARNLSGGQPGVILMDAQNAPVAFVPVNPAEANLLRKGGRMDALYRALSVANAGAAIIVNDGQMGDAVVQNLAGLFNLMDARVLDVMDLSGNAVRSWAEQGKSMGGTSFMQDKGAARGSFNPTTNTITLLKNADLSTFLHEAGHYFFENDIALAAELANKPDPTEGERQILADVSALLTWHGINGPIDEQLAQWYGLEFEARRSYHERTAESFERYLFEGNAPSIELQGYFQKFRAWMLNVYRSLKDFLARNPEAGQLNDEVRAVFDRMLATNEQIALAEQARSMLPLFNSPDQAGMTVEEFARYQALGIEATADAIQDVQARTLRDLAWARNARGREIKRLQKEAKARRAEVQMEVRREVMRQPVYRAWQFLTGKLTSEDKLPPLERPKSGPNVVDASQDSLFVAIAKLGGIQREQLESEWGTDPKEKVAQPVFGKPVIRREGGRTLDGMAEALSEYGYLTLDENGKWDNREFEELFFDELRGTPQFSNAVDPEVFQDRRPGEQVRNPEALGAGRLDLAGLNSLSLPDEIVEHVKNLKMTARDGLHPDIVAEMFGFSSGDELVRSLAAAEAPRVEIEGRTDQAMLERYGELATPAAIERAADKAIHNDARARFVATEANALAKATGQRKILTQAARDFARAMIARLKIRDIRPSQYAQAEVRAAKAAAVASQSGELETAATEKRNQLVQNYATRAAYDAQEDIEKGVRYLRKFDKDIGTLDPDYADQIHALLERFELRALSLKAIDKRAALANWIEAQREAGFEPDIPDALKNEAFRKSFKDMTVEEFRGLVDTVRQIEHLGRLKNRLLTAADNRAFDAVKQEIVKSIEENAGNREADTRTPTTNLGRLAQSLKRFWASHIKAATWARVLDGGKDGGPMWEYFVRAANERGDMETTMRAEATLKLTEILAPVFKLGRMGGKGQFFPTINRSLNREARIALALNIGNEGNLQRLLGGEGWTVAKITPVLQSLTAQEWAAVQAVWDYFESYRPQIGAKERRVYGREPQWIEAQPFTVKTADGQEITLRGGYYPIKYDPAASQRAEEYADAEGAKRQLQGAFTTATTRRSFTKTRTEEVSGRPLLYTLAGLYSGVNDVIHDLAWHEWLIDANRLLRSKSIDAAIRNHYGPEAKAQLKTWAADIAEGDKAAQNAGEVALGRLRQGISAAGLGFNAVSAAMQIMGFNQSIVRVGAGWIGRGVTRYIGSPAATAREVVGKSSFMAERARTQFRELNELRNKVQDESAAMRNIKAGTYFLMMRMQRMVDMPTWLGAYEKAIAGGHDEDRAVALADQAVIDSQGSGMTKDLSAIERGGPALKIFTVFYSYMNTAFNMGVAQTMTAKNKGRLAAELLLLYTVPAVLGKALKDAITPGGDDDDLDAVARGLAAEQLSYLMGTMFVVREFAEVAKIVTGAEGVRDYQGPAGLRAISDALKFATQASQGEFDTAFRKSAINLVGDLSGLPAAQINRTWTGIEALAEGETSNPAAAVFGYQTQ